MIKLCIRRSFSFGGMSFQEIKTLKPKKYMCAESIRDNLKQSQLTMWRYKKYRDCISRKIEFKDFGEAMSFMNSIAKFSETIQHHPEWFNVYNLLKINLRTHDCNGVSLKDFYLARYIDIVEQKISNSEVKSLTNVVEISEKEFHEFKKSK